MEDLGSDGGGGGGGWEDRTAGEEKEAGAGWKFGGVGRSPSDGGGGGC